MRVISKSATTGVLILEGSSEEQKSLLIRLVNLGIGSFTVSDNGSQVTFEFSKEIDFYTTLGIVQYYKNEPTC